MSDRTLTLAITTFNRTDMLYECFSAIRNDERITEIVIVDDCSSPACFQHLSTYFELLKCDKIKIFRNNSNLGVYRNKKRSVELSTSEWVIVFDSDNIIGKDYIDRIFSFDWNPDHAYLPEFAKPTFDYRNFSGMTIAKNNAASISQHRGFGALINTMNALYHKETYLQLWNTETIIEPNNSDSIYLNYLFLNAGKKLSVVKGLEYFHRVHKGSHYQQNGNKGAMLFAELMRRIKFMT